jgi:hypothetical protein
LTLSSVVNLAIFLCFVLFIIAMLLWILNYKDRR